MMSPRDDRPLDHGDPSRLPVAAQTKPKDFADSAPVHGDAVVEVVRRLYAELHHVPLDSAAVAPESSLERDLGFDSLTRVELLVRLEHDLGVHLPEELLGSVETVADVVREVTAASVAGPRSGSAGTATPAIVRRTSPRPVLEEPRRAATLNEVLEWHVERNPDATHAVVLADERSEPLSYAQLYDGARRVAGGLIEAGVRPRSTVALMLPTGSGYLRVFMGALLAGAIPVPIYPPTRPSQLEEHVHRHAGILANAGVDCLVTFQEARTVARLLSTRVPGLRHVLSIGDLEQGQYDSHGGRAPAADSIAMLQYTSGSTGAPKGVTLTHAHLLANIRAMGTAVKATAADVFVSWLPLYHDMGLIGAWLGSLYYGCQFVVMPPLAFLTRPARWLRAIHEYRATLSAGPNFAYELCVRRLSDADLAGLDLSCWRVAFNGAEPVFADTLERFARRLAPAGLRPQALTPVYGLAEAAVGLTFPPLDRGAISDCIDRDRMMRAGEAVAVAGEHPRALRFVSCGRPLPGYEVRIVDPRGVEVPERIEGGVQFMGPSATSGYYRNPDANARLFHEGWLDTGDRGYMAGGELYVTGRVKDIIIRRGRHIYPDEIERAVGELEGVRKGCVAAFGAHEPSSATEKLVVLAETRQGDPTHLAQLKSRINECIVDRIGEPPEEILLAAPHTVLKTSSGKLRRAATRAAYEDGSLGRAPASAAMQLARLALESIPPALRRMQQECLRIVYGLYVWSLAACFATVVGLTSLLLPQHRQVWWLSHHAARWLIRGCGIRFTVTREAGSSLAGPHVVVTNHCSYVDSLFLAAVLPGLHLFVAKAELQRTLLLRTWLRRIGVVFIERFLPVQSAAEVARLKRELTRGNSLVMFPEGTFTRATGLRPFHLGAFQTAVETGTPIIPVTLRGTRSVLRDGQWLPRRLPVSAVVGCPLTDTADGDVFSAAVRLRDAAREHILRRCGEPDLL
jgi:acyl carrier protein